MSKIVIVICSDSERKEEIYLENLITKNEIEMVTELDAKVEVVDDYLKVVYNRYQLFITIKVRD